MRRRLTRWLLGGLVITKETRRLSLVGREVAVTFCYPAARAEAPVDAWVGLDPVDVDGSALKADVFVIFILEGLFSFDRFGERS